MEKLMNKKEMAEYLGLSVKAIDKWVSGRTIPFIKLSQKCVRFMPSEISKYLKEHKVRPGAFNPPKKKGKSKKR